MKIDAVKINKDIYIKYYYSGNEYEIQYDKDMTYQELSLVLSCHAACGIGEEFVDTESLIDCVDYYEEEFISQFDNPVSKTFPWDKVMERLYRERKPNLRKDESGNNISWKLWDEYKEAWNDALKRRKELNEAFEIEMKNRKDKNNEYQRQRRERMKKMDSSSTSKKTDNQLGERLKARRKELNMTLKDLSLKTMLKPQLISDYENGRKEPGIKNFKLICNGLQANPNYFLLEDVDMSERKDTYGYLFKTLFEYVDNSPNDTLVIDDEKEEVYLKIEDPNLKNALLKLKAFMGNEDFAFCLKNLIGTYVLANEKIQKKNSKN